MSIKESIEKLLIALKAMGFDRRTIEQELEYSENSIDQILSKGGNKKFLATIKRYHIEKSNTGVTYEQIIGLKAATTFLIAELKELKAKVYEVSQSKISLEVDRDLQQLTKHMMDEMKGAS